MGAAIWATSTPLTACSSDRGASVKPAHLDRTSGALPRTPTTSASSDRAKEPKPRYARRLTRLVDELKANSRVDVELAEIGAPTAAGKLASARESAPDLGSSVFAFYEEVSSFTLKWRGVEVPEGENWVGAVDVRPIDDVAGPEVGKGRVWFDDTPEESPLRRLRPMDIFQPEACMALYPVPGKATVHYHYFGESLLPTGLTFDAWFDRLIASRGFWYWIRACTGDTDATAVAAFRKGASELFEEFDATLFVPTTNSGEIAF